MRKIIVCILTVILLLCSIATIAEENSKPSISLSEKTLILIKGKSVTLKATVDPKKTKLLWSSSDENVAKVTGNGKVQGVSAGEAVITVTVDDKSGVFETCTVTVVSPVKKIIIDSGKTVNLPIGYSQQLKTSIQPEDASIKDLNWSSSNEKVVTVNEQGIVSAIAKGKAKITATAVDGSKVKTSITINVDQYDLIFLNDKPQEATYYYHSGKFKITGKAKYGCVSVPKDIGIVMAMIIGGPASETVTVTPVKPGTDTVTIKAGRTKTVIKAFVSPDAFKEKDEEKELIEESIERVNPIFGKYMLEWQNCSITIHDMKTEDKILTVSYTFENGSYMTKSANDVFEDTVTQNDQTCPMEMKSSMMMDKQKVEWQEKKNYQVEYELKDAFSIVKLVINVLEGEVDKPLILYIDPETQKWGLKYEVPEA